MGILEYLYICLAKKANDLLYKTLINVMNLKMILFVLNSKT